MTKKEANTLKAERKRAQAIIGSMNLFGITSVNLRVLFELLNDEQLLELTEIVTAYMQDMIADIDSELEDYE